MTGVEAGMTWVEARMTEWGLVGGGGGARRDAPLQVRLQLGVWELMGV